MQYFVAIILLKFGWKQITIPTGLMIGCVDHGDVNKWKHFPRYWPFVRGIHRSSVYSLHKGQRSGALMFSLMCAWKKRLSKHQPRDCLLNRLFRRRSKKTSKLRVTGLCEGRNSSVTCVNWVNNREAGDLRRHRAHYDVTVMNNHNVDNHSNMHNCNGKDNGDNEKSQIYNTDANGNDDDIDINADEMTTIVIKKIIVMSITMKSMMTFVHV